MSNYSYKYYRTDKPISARIVRKVVSEFDFFNDKSDVTEIRYRYNGSTIIAYEEFQRVIFKPYVIRHIIRIGEKNSNLLGELDKLNKKYTPSSIINAIGRTRALGYFIAEKKCYCKPEDRYYPVEFNAFRRTISLPIDSQTKTASDALVERDLQMLTNLADRLWRDLNDIVALNTKELVRKPIENNKSKKTEAEILNFVLKVAVKFGVAVVGGMVGANINLPDDGSSPDVDFDFDSDYSSDTSVDYDNDSDVDTGDGLAFQGKDSLPPNANSDGYIPKGDITLTKTLSGNTESFKLFTNSDGNKFVLYYHKYIQIDGPSSTVTIHGVKFNTI